MAAAQSRRTHPSRGLIASGLPTVRQAHLSAAGVPTVPWSQARTVFHPGERTADRSIAKTSHRPLQRLPAMAAAAGHPRQSRLRPVGDPEPPHPTTATEPLVRALQRSELQRPEHPKHGPPLLNPPEAHWARGPAPASRRLAPECVKTSNRFLGQPPATAGRPPKSHQSAGLRPPGPQRAPHRQSGRVGPCAEKRAFVACAHYDPRQVCQEAGSLSVKGNTKR